MDRDLPVHLRLEWTPNPNVIKYVLNAPLIERGAVNFISADSARGVPLPSKLFEIKGVEGVLIGRTFITVTKGTSTRWEEVHRLCSQTITKHLDNKESVLGDFVIPPPTVTETTTAEENKIRKILEEEIRPALANDGGDVSFESYEDGIVYVRLKGACSGCPSATITLKMGIEARLRQDVPNLLDVVQV